MINKIVKWYSNHLNKCSQWALSNKHWLKPTIDNIGLVIQFNIHALSIFALSYLGTSMFKNFGVSFKTVIILLIAYINPIALLFEEIRIIIKQFFIKR